MNLTQEDIRELLVVLNRALYDTEALIGQSHDPEEAKAYREHRAIIRRWIHRLSMEIEGESDGQETFAED